MNEHERMFLTQPTCADGANGGFFDRQNRESDIEQEDRREEELQERIEFIGEAINTVQTAEFPRFPKNLIEAIRERWREKPQREVKRRTAVSFKEPGGKTRVYVAGNEEK